MILQGILQNRTHWPYATSQFSYAPEFLIVISLTLFFAFALFLALDQKPEAEK